jgi:hypothetical protein
MLAALVFGIRMAGCNVDWFHEPRPPSLTIDDQTDRDLRLVDVRRGPEFPDVGVAPHNTTSFTLAFGMESASCASGSLVAKDGSTVIATVDRPCAGTTWAIPADAPSS